MSVHVVSLMVPTTFLDSCAFIVHCTESVDPAERDAALTMCMISGSSEQSESGVSELLHAVIHDHCYTKCPVVAVPSPPDSPCPQVTVKLHTAGRSRRKSNKSG